MTELTPVQAAVFAALRTLHRGRHGETVGAAEIRDRCWDDNHIHYDQVHKTLNQLIDLGLVEKPRRGRYVPLEATDA